MSCPVCFGGGDPVMRESLNAGIGVLLGVTGLVLAAFARFFVGLARRSREAAHLVGGPVSSDQPPSANVPTGSVRFTAGGGLQASAVFGELELQGWELAPDPRHAAGTRAPDGGSR